MGQLPTRDQRPQLPVQINSINVHCVSNKQPLHICPVLSIQKAKRIFFVQNQDELEAIYRFGSKYTVHVQLRKQRVRIIQGVYIKLSDDHVYAYKHRKLDRAEKIKPQKLLFKKRIYAKTMKLESQLRSSYESGSQSTEMSQQESTQKRQQLLVLCFAQIKLMSLLEIGSSLGRVHTQCDGILTSEYIEYYSQVTIDKISQSIAKNSQLKQLQKKLQEKNLYYEGLLKNENLSYSRWRKGYVLKQLKFTETSLHIKNTIKQSVDNQSIHYIIRMFETQVTRVIMDLDNEAKMLPFMNNLIFQNNFDKQITKMDQKITIIENEKDKINNEKMKPQKQFSSSFNELNQQGSSECLNSLSKAQTNSLTKLVPSNPQKIKTPKRNKSKENKQKEKSNNHQSIEKQQKNESKSSKLIQKQHKTNNKTQIQSKNKQKSIQGSPQQILITQEQSNNPTEQKSINLNIKKEKHETKTQQNHKHSNQLDQYKTKLTFAQKLKSLKNSILDKNNTKSYQILQQLIELNCKKSIQIQIIFCKLLLENARSRHALTILQRIMHFVNQVPQSQIYFYYEIALIAGILHFHRYSYQKALKSFQKALSILVKLSHYSIKMICIYSNIACVYYVMKNYQKCMFYLHRGFKIGEYSVDYEYLMRSNTAMTLAEMGKIKEAKIQMLKINKIIEPVNNMVVFCKFYSNLAYLQLIDSGDSRSLQKAMNNFEEACNIQEKYLIPNGYRPSIFLHNNIAMLHYKRKQFKKAKFHSEKIINQLNDVEGLVAIRVHFNIGKIFSQGYNYDLPLKHFHEARIILNKIDENKQPSIKLYRQRICKEIEELQRMRIDEVSQQESHKFSYMSSSLLKKV